MAEDLFKVTDVHGASRLDRAANVRQVIRVEFMVGDLGPFFHEFEQVDFTPGNVKEKLNAFAKNIVELPMQGKP